VSPWSAVPPEVDPDGDLGLWVAALGEPSPSAPGRPAALTVAEAGGTRTLRLILETERPRPAAASRHGCGVVFDGALFNRRELASQLGIAADAALDDASLVLSGYLRWGRDVLQRVKGIFAVVVWDGRSDSLLCARDRTGVYPLFYVEAGGTLVVSTSIDALLRYPGVPSALDGVTLAGDLMFRGPGPEDTYFAAVKRLTPGSLMEIRGATRRVSRYWDPAPPDAPGRWAREEEREQFDALLEQAVTRGLELGRSCIYLSGGIDSAGVATVAADVCRRDGRPMPVALLMDHSEIGVDEMPRQTGIATSLGLPRVRRSYRDLISHESVLEETLEWTRTWPWPILYPSVLAYVGLSLEAKTRGCRVLLTGEGGDEWTAVHPLYGAELLRAGNLVGFAGMLRASWRSYPWKRWQFVRVSSWTCGLRPLLVNVVRRLLRVHAPDALRAHRRRRILTHVPDWLAPDPTVRRALEERILRDVEHDLAMLETPGIYGPAVRPMLEVSFDHDFERSRRTGLRLFHPYWDADVVDFFYRTPASAHCVEGRTKGLVRRRLARRFPVLGYGTQRKLVMPPMEQELLMTRAPSAWVKHGGAPTLAALGVVHHPRLQRTMDGFFARPEAVDYLHQVWTPLHLEAWARAHAS
jgi:asparagine synthetase B (glutamine-hydrolysing)